MKPIKCPKCGNKKNFREWVLIHRNNYFVQRAKGNFIKEHVSDIQDSEFDSKLFCDVCDFEMEEEYSQFLDNYSETPFKKRNPLGI